MAEYIDIHCHCLPGLDDGPADEAGSLDLCRALVADGVSTVIATPHQLGRYEDACRVDAVRAAVDHLNVLLVDAGIHLRVLAGGEVRLDERIGGLLRANKISTLADRGRWLLLELPSQCFIDITPLIEQLASSQIRVIIAHVERCAFFKQRLPVLHQWARLGACFQITAAALPPKGGMGGALRTFAWHLLQSPLPCVVASDAHDLVNRRPMMTHAFDAVQQTLGRDRARELFIDIPRCIAEGRDILDGCPPDSGATSADASRQGD
ncbi:MAG: hypothetical protein IH624_03345 [Phycisphaerae bacterium]|nr:hypothetical protein [Phycisphaerae bacterium]